MTPAEKVCAYLRDREPLACSMGEDGGACTDCKLAHPLADVVKAGSWCATFAPRAAQAEFDEAIRRAAEVCG